MIDWQVMYMYYLLRYRMSEIIQREHLPIGMDESMATKTFILALDGDIDFKPDAVRALLDSMKRNKDTAAACGRIHPVGPAGPAIFSFHFIYIFYFTYYLFMFIHLFDFLILFLYIHSILFTYFHSIFK